LHSILYFCLVLCEVTKSDKHIMKEIQSNFRTITRYCNIKYILLETLSLFKGEFRASQESKRRDLNIILHIS
jgi:hypothetical protein